jgi:hypothetical protein
MRDHAKLAIVLIATGLGGTAQAQSDRYDALANSPPVENRPTAETSKRLKDELLFQRATQIYLWALPLINTLVGRTVEAQDREVAPTRNSRQPIACFPVGRLQQVLEAG